MGDEAHRDDVEALKLEVSGLRRQVAELQRAASREGVEALQSEVAGLRARVGELQRAAVRNDERSGVSLLEREELLRDAERVAHLGTWTWDLASGNPTWSDEMYRILGLEPGSVAPSAAEFMSRIHPEDRALVQTEIERAAKTGVVHAQDFRVVRPDGSIRHINGSSVMVFDTTSGARRIVGGVLDRTDNMEAELNLRRTLGLLEEAQRFAQLGSWRLDPRSGALEWSQEFRRIAGIPEDVPARAELFFERLVPEDRSRLEADYWRALTTFEASDINARLQRPDGQLRHVRLTGFAVVGLGGAVELRGTMLDMTDQVRMREELAQAQKMEAVGRLAGGIAHDFNNLLTVILANLDLLAVRIGSPPEIENSVQAVSSAANLTRRLLAYGRKAQLSLKLVPPNVLVGSMTALMQRLVGDEVKLEIDLASDLPQVSVDPLEIERALVNLVVNARDAMHGRGVVHIATNAQEVDGALQVELSVGDEGPGIDETIRAHIFEPFFTTRADVGGTGLGLATVLGTAEQHGGTVRVEARPGGGTVFTMALPAAALSGGGKPAHVPRVSLSEHRLRSLQLLIVDDETKVADALRRILEARGHTVRVASRPEEALQLWSACGVTIDLVICDIVMTPMRGPELVLRMAEQGVKPRVLFITGYSDEAVRDGLGHPVLTKPFMVEDLLAMIADMLGEAGRAVRPS